MKERTKTLRKLIGALYGKHLELRIRLFNVMASIGGFVGVLMSVLNIFTGAGFADLILCLSTAVSAVALLWYANTSKNYKLTYIITTIIIFFIIFPLMFFAVSGYNSGIMSWFLFAVIFTIFMLKGKTGIIMAAIELALYTALCFMALYIPDFVPPLNSSPEWAMAMALDTIISFMVVCIALGFIIWLHFDLYDKQQHELEAARKQAEDYARIKSELFAVMSHEMRTPLSVMSAYAQYAVKQIKENGINEQTLADLNAISDEAARLADMADDTLKILMSFQEASEIGAFKNSPVDISVITKRITRLLEPVAARRGCKIILDIKKLTSPQTGNPDALTQMLWNILQNAVAYSGAQIISLRIEEKNDNLIMTIKDNGCGISPDILSRIFERGVRKSLNGHGIGLYVCREIALSHGGDISIDSGSSGTEVRVSLPFFPKIRKE